MKKTYYIKVFVSLLLATVPLGTFAQRAAFTPALDRAAAQAKQLSDSTVQVMLDWHKEVKMSDVMFRRPRVKDSVISVKRKQTYCKGTLLQDGEHVLIPAVCAHKNKYHLDQVTLKFANGYVAQGSAQVLRTKEDIAVITVNAQATQGLRGLPVAAIPSGQTLQETFGESMKDWLLQFFHRKGIPSRSRRCGRHRYRTRSNPSLQVGDPVIYNGKLVALVQKIPHVYRDNVFGGVTEKYLALVRL